MWLQIIDFCSNFALCAIFRNLIQGENLLPAHHDAISSSTSSYNKRKPHFRTFSPNPTSAETSASVYSNNDIIRAADTLDSSSRTLPPKSDTVVVLDIRSTLPSVRTTKAPRSREDHSVNSYMRGFSLDTDVDTSSYPSPSINEFMLSNAKEDVV